MNNSLKKYGFAGTGIVVVLALVVVGAFAFFLGFDQAEKMNPGALYQTNSDSNYLSDAPILKTEEVPIGKEQALNAGGGDVVLEFSGLADQNFTGKIFAGNQSPLIDFNQADYDAALKSNKLIVLYFYASWCPICRVEFPRMEDAFDKLTTDQVIGFRVNYNDGDTDNYEKNIAREFGVAYQHTKVFLKNGTRILKASDNWTTDRYTAEINKALSQ